MVKVLRNKIKVHCYLRVLFGRETTVIDLLTIVIGSVSLAVLTIFFTWNEDLSGLKKIILTILSLDIGGGVIANFTQGTNKFYAESLRMKYLFVFFHLLQPSILIWIFPNELLAIFSGTIYTLTSSFILLLLKSGHYQKIIAVTLLVLSLILSAFLSYNNSIAQLIMHLFSLKLILAFSVNWIANNKA